MDDSPDRVYADRPVEHRLDRRIAPDPDPLAECLLDQDHQPAQPASADDGPTGVPLLVTLDGAAELSGVELNVVRRAVDAGDLVTIRVGRQRLIHRQAVVAWVGQLVAGQR